MTKRTGKTYAVMRCLVDGTCGFSNPRHQWEVSKTRTDSYDVALAAAGRLESRPRNRMLGWRFYAARVA